MASYVLFVMPEFEHDLQTEVTRYNSTKEPTTPTIDALGLLASWIRPHLLAIQRAAQEREHHARRIAFDKATPEAKDAADTAIGFDKDNKEDV